MMMMMMMMMIIIMIIITTIINQIESVCFPSSVPKMPVLPCPSYKSARVDEELIDEDAARCV